VNVIAFHSDLPAASAKRLCSVDAGPSSTFLRRRAVTGHAEWRIQRLESLCVEFHSVDAERLAGKGVQIQAVLPGAVGTESGHRGLPVEKFPQEIVMPVEAGVDAALAGLDQGELVTILSLPDIEIGKLCRRPGKALRPNLSLSQPAARYSTEYKTH